MPPAVVLAVVVVVVVAAVVVIAVVVEVAAAAGHRGRHQRRDCERSLQGRHRTISRPVRVLRLLMPVPTALRPRAIPTDLRVTWSSPRAASPRSPVLEAPRARARGRSRR